MPHWTVYKVRSLRAGGAGQGLEKLGTLEAPHWAAAIRAAHEAYAHAADPRAPQGGLAVVIAAGSPPIK